jgi:hypothetical protein
LKPERWGSLLVQETYQEEKACDKRHTHNNNNIIIRDIEKGTCMLIDVAIPGRQKCDKERSREDSKI